MNGKKALFGIGIGATFATVSALALSMTMAFYVKNANSDGSYGEISLRSYYETGSGTEDDPFVITRPRHLYNFSRLQGLGVYGQKTYFRLGFALDDEDATRRGKCYASNSSPELVPYLNMEDSDYSASPIYAIGSEAVPFYGEFDGQGLEIKHLNVYADPEDAGLFGYTAHGSDVHDLFLDDITINTLGYTSEYSGLYSDDSLASGVGFRYFESASSASPSTTFTASSSETTLAYADGAITGDVLSLDLEQNVPYVEFYSPSDSYRYKTLISGNLLTESEGKIMPDLAELSSFFEERRKDADQEFPAQASASVSILAYQVDSNGIEHTKVLLPLVFTFTLDSLDSTRVRIETMVGAPHFNNIGLLIGHCDGSISDCYVHDGKFVMNDGSTITGTAHTAMANGSNLGLIGLVGNTVQNVSSSEAAASTGAGKDIGVIDFTTIYDNIIDDNSFVGSQSISGGRTYFPSSDSKYLEYLRTDTDGNYITLANNTVSFAGRAIITNTDLGVFTVATDNSTTGTGPYAFDSLNNCVIRSEDVTSSDIDDGYFLYYGTGEYSASSGLSFDTYYRTALTSQAPNGMVLGHFLPDPEQTSVDSFAYREWVHNYYFRFQLNPEYRAARSFYFADLDVESRGGNYLAKYFNYKLVDQSGQRIPSGVGEDGKRSTMSGVMLRDRLGHEITGFNSNFATPDLSSIPRYYLGDTTSPTAAENPAAKTINFEIKSHEANVTVVCGNVDTSKSSALGVYRITDDDYAVSDLGVPYIDKPYNEPDYAFFLPNDEHLAYFDYVSDSSNTVGKIGNYDSDGNFSEATDAGDEATVPRAFGATTDFGYDSGKARLFVHTFKLPQGHYCFGSATGSGGESLGTAKIYYVCAQGQDNGEISFDDNAFAGGDVVENVDFIKQAKNPDEGEFGPIYSERCYILLSDSDRSSFASSPAPADVEFVYEGGKFKIKTSTPSAITRFVLTNYGASQGQSDLTISLVQINGGGAETATLLESTDQIVFYAYGS